MDLPDRPNPCNAHKPRIRLTNQQASRSNAPPIVQPAADRPHRINIFVGAHWCHLDLADAESTHQQLGDAIAAVKAHQESAA